MRTAAARASSAVAVADSSMLSRYVSECGMSMDLLVAEAVLEFGRNYVTRNRRCRVDRDQLHPVAEARIRIVVAIVTVGQRTMTTESIDGSGNLRVASPTPPNFLSRDPT
jgi:sugar/nucleoside kinase (ribokinase family)